MKETFVEFLYRRLAEDIDLDEIEISEDEIGTAEEALAIDELDLDTDSLSTYSYEYKQMCEENGETPDFTGYEDYA